MELAFPWPMTDGEWLAWASAAVTVLFGLFMLFAPRLALRVLRLQTAPERAEAVAEVRATMAGFPLALGACAILLAQPLLYMTLGFAWLVTAFGRLIAMLSDQANTPYNWLFLVIDLVLAAMPLAYAFGFMP